MCEISFSSECGAGDGRSQTDLHGDGHPGNGHHGNRVEGGRGVRYLSEVATSREWEVELNQGAACGSDPVPVRTLRTAPAVHALQASCWGQSSPGGAGVDVEAAAAAGTPWAWPGERVWLWGEGRSSGAGESGGEGPPVRSVVRWGNVDRGPGEGAADGAWQRRERGRGDGEAEPATETGGYWGVGPCCAESVGAAAGRAVLSPLSPSREAP